MIDKLPDQGNVTHTANQPDGQSVDVAGFLGLLHPEGVFEIRILNTPDRKNGSFKATASGFFSDVSEATKEVAKWSKVEPPGIYCTINPVDDALLARSRDKIKFRAKSTTSKEDVLRRRHLFIDIDPIRKSDISSTESEMLDAVQASKAIRFWLADRGWPEPLRMMSGNGAYLIYRIDLPNDDDSENLIKRFINAIAVRFTDEKVDVDTSVFDANRICKIGGTFARKGDNLVGIDPNKERPHRQSCYIAPASFDVVETSLIQSVANEYKPAEPEAKASQAAPSSIPAGDVGRIIKRCRNYIATLDPAVSGDDGHDKMLEACAHTARFSLSESQSLPIIQEYNLRCQPPFDDKDLQRKLSEGHKKAIAAGEWGKHLRGDASQSGAAGQGVASPVEVHNGAELLDGYIADLKSGNVPKLHNLGNALNGLEVCAGLITIIGAPPGQGKTALASQICFEACQQNENLIAYVANAEMSFEAIARRELTRITSINADKIRFAELSKWDLEKIEKAAAELRKLLERVKFVLNPTHGSLLELLDHEPGLIIVDYLQKFAPADVDPRIGVNQVMTTLRRLASQGFSVLALSATKRDAKGGHASKELSLSSFRESGEVEFNADSAYVLRDDGSMEGRDSLRKVTLAHVKNRHGNKLSRVLRFDMPKMSFERIEEPEPERHSEFDEYETTSDGLFELGGGYE